VDIEPDISHTIHLGVPPCWLWLSAQHSNRSLQEWGALL
jgi:hypothetical protein